MVISWKTFESSDKTHCVKSVQIWSFFWSVFYLIRMEYGKIGTRKNSVYEHFSRSDLADEVII